MPRKDVGIDAIYDIRAVRILVGDVKDCYAALGIVHNLWTPMPGEFDDYIAKPKANDYRSLHTAVIGPEGKPLEVQIRTREMHQHSEYGVAAHWRYKEGGGRETRRDPGFDEKIAWLRQVLDWKDAVADAGEWLTGFKESLFTDTIYVLTPQGKVIDLPRGATPVDFAYAVHTDLGHRCRGARVDGQMVPLNHRLAQRAARRHPHGEAGRAVAATGSTPSSATSPAIARAPRSASGSSTSSTTRRSRRAARSSSASSRAPGATALKLEALANQAGVREARRVLRRGRARRSQPAADPVGDQGARRSRPRPRPTRAGSRGGDAQEPRERIRRRHPGRRRRPSDDRARALLQAGAAGSRSSASSRAARASRSTARPARTSKRVRASSPSG